MILPTERIVVNWKGKAVSKNRMHMAHPHLQSRQVIHTPEYRAFLQSLVIQFMADRPEKPIVKPIDVCMRVVVGVRMDPHNVIDPVMDALEQAGIVANDKLCRRMFFDGELRHRDGMEDFISVFVTEERIFDAIFGSPEGEKHDSTVRKDLIRAVSRGR